MHLNVAALATLASSCLIGCTHVRGMAETYRLVVEESTIDDFRVEQRDDSASKDFERKFDGMQDTQVLARDLRGKSAAERAEILRAHRSYHPDDDESLAGELLGAAIEPIFSAVFLRTVKLTSDIIKTPFAYVSSLRDDRERIAANADYEALVEAGRQIQSRNIVPTRPNVIPASATQAHSNEPISSAAFVE